MWTGPETKNMRTSFGPAWKAASDGSSENRLFPPDSYVGAAAAIRPFSASASTPPSSDPGVFPKRATG